jgi:hypothetical protein
MGLSTWTSPDSARAKNNEFGGKLGDRIAELELSGDLGVWWAQTFNPEHVTVWGRPEDLDRCVRNVDTV